MNGTHTHTHTTTTLLAPNYRSFIVARAFILDVFHFGYFILFLVFCFSAVQLVGPVSSHFPFSFSLIFCCSINPCPLFAHFLLCSHFLVYYCRTACVFGMPYDKKETTTHTHPHWYQWYHLFCIRLPLKISGCFVTTVLCCLSFYFIQFRLL